MISGVAGLLLGLGKYYNIRGVCLLAEASTPLMIPDPKAAEALLKVLSEVLKIEIDLQKLEKRIEEMESFFKKLQQLQKKAIREIIEAKPSPEKLTYIG
jgi:hypothetical protein